MGGRVEGGVCDEAFPTEYSCFHVDLEQRLGRRPICDPLALALVTWYCKHGCAPQPYFLINLFLFKSRGNGNI